MTTTCCLFWLDDFVRRPWEDGPFGLQHRLGDLIWLWRYQVDVRACGMSVEQYVVQKFGFLIGRVLAGIVKLAASWVA
jgi:hypothetical protein